jgi:hypothetical protein
MKGYTQQVANLIMSAILLSIGAWGGSLWACSWLECWPWVRGAAVIGAVLFVLVPVGLGYRAKALRMARGRQPLRPLAEFNLTTFSQNVTGIFTKAPESIPMLDEPDRGWQVPFTDGDSVVRVNVYKMELYSWLVDCYIQQRRLTGRKSAISQRSNRNLDKLQQKARIILLKRTNAVIRNSNASNSTLYLRVFENKEPIEAAWYVVDELLEEIEASKKIW